MKPLTILLLAPGLAFAQPAEEGKKPSLEWSGYIEIFYQYDFNRPGSKKLPPFLYNHNRHHEFNLNLGYLKASYTAERGRAALALGAGTYMDANYAAETGLLKQVYEASAGIRLMKKKNAWLDLGILPSHIGFESAEGKSCTTLTRSLLAENSPYYEAGARLSYRSENGKWYAGLLALNGWQRITRVAGNSGMSWGAQLQFKPGEKTLLNYSHFSGTDKPDTARLWRIFHNLYAVIPLNNKVGLTLGFDIGTEEKAQDGGVNTWYSPVGILSYAPHDDWSLAGRIEYFDDPGQVIVKTGTPHGFKTGGYSVNIDYKPAKNVLARLEARNLVSRDAVFFRREALVKNRFYITGAVAVSF